MHKTLLLKELCARGAVALNLDTERISGEIFKREELGSTGVGGGVAIPHARLGGLKTPFGILARLDGPIDFNAIDSQPEDIVFLLLLPALPAGEQTAHGLHPAKRFLDALALDRTDAIARRAKWSAHRSPSGGWSRSAGRAACSRAHDSNATNSAVS